MICRVKNKMYKDLQILNKRSKLKMLCYKFKHFWKILQVEIVDKSNDRINKIIFLYRFVRISKI